MIEEYSDRFKSEIIEISSEKFYFFEKKRTENPSYDLQQFYKTYWYEKYDTGLSFYEALQGLKARAFLILRNSEHNIIAIASYSSIPSVKHNELGIFLVHPDYLQKKLGTFLVQKSVEKILEVNKVSFNNSPIVFETTAISEAGLGFMKKTRSWIQQRLGKGFDLIIKEDFVDKL